MLRMMSVLLAYQLSSIGLIFIVYVIASPFISSNASLKSWVLALIWFSACVLHIAMSIAWIFDNRLGRLWSAVGVVLALLGYLPLPLMLIFDSRDSYFGSNVEANAWLLGVVLGWELFLTAPIFLLGIWLLYYHWQSPKQGQFVTNTNEHGQPIIETSQALD